jgi:N-acyl-D-amino-acid deacylase
MEYMDAREIVLNCGLLAPHGVMRISACGMETRLANREEIAEMARSLEGCMEAGAFGLSTGLQYFPGNQSDTDELVELGRTLAKYDGIFTSHLRSYTASTLPKAMEEVAEVSRKNGIRSQISHIFSLPWFGPVHKPVLKSLKWLINHPQVSRFVPDFAVEMEMKAILKRLDQLNSDSAQVGMDFMPTTAGFTHLMAFFPSWALTGGREAVLKRAADPAARKEILEDIEKGKPTWPHRGKNDWSLNIMRQMGWDAVTIMAVHSEKNKHMEGRRFTEIGEELGKHPFDVMCDLLLEEEGRVLVFESMAEPDDIFTETYTFPAIRYPDTMVVTDTILMGIGKPSYLFYCTSLPAGWFGIKDRGQVREGYYADLLVMDAPNFRTEAVFRDPERYTEGLEMVIINGSVVLEGGREPLALTGKMLRK